MPLPVTAYVVVLTFLSAIAGHPKQAVVPCPTAVCAHEFMEHAHESRLLSRLRVWKAEEFAPLPLGDSYVWPPIVDLWFQ